MRMVVTRTMTSPSLFEVPCRTSSLAEPKPPRRDRKLPYHVSAFLRKDAMKRALVNCAGIYQTIDYWMIQMFTAAIASKADKPHLEFILTREGNVVAEANALQLH